MPPPSASPAASRKEQLRRQIWRFHPFSAAAERMVASVRHRAGGPKPVRLLLVSDGVNLTSEQQFAPLRRHANALRDQLGLVTEHRLLEAALRLSPSALRQFDAIGLKLSFMTPPADAAQIAGQLAQALRGSGTRLVYFDGDDDVCVQWGPVIDAVDLYVKKHLFADEAAYLRSYQGKSNLTDHIATHHGVSFADNPIPRCEALPPAALGKLHLGWNIALDDKIADLHRQMAEAASGPVGPDGPAPMDRRRERDIDVSCRASVPPSTWTYPLRNQAVEQMEAMAASLRVLAPRDRVSQQQYYDEMLRSRICVSPFGYGELCWRDFEAILCGCLLVKPDMGHLRTFPDVFVPHVTYVPVRWDFADLHAQCARYAADETARRRIADAALAALDEGLSERAAVGAVAALLARLGLHTPRTAAAAAG